MSDEGGNESVQLSEVGREKGAHHRKKGGRERERLGFVRECRGEREKLFNENVKDSSLLA